MSDSKRARKASTSSRRLLAFCVVMTSLIAIVGSLVLWNLYQSAIDAVASPDAQDEVVPSDAFRVALGRTTGGPEEWRSYASAFLRLETAVGRPVLIEYVQDGASARRLVGSAEVDLAFVSTETYLSLSESGVGTLVAAPVIARQDHDTAVLVVSSASDVQSVEQLEGARVSVTYGSLAGDAYTSWLMQQRGTTVCSFFTSVKAAESHDAALKMVADGQVDVTSVRRSDLTLWSQGRFRVIEESPSMGMPPIVARDGLDPDELVRVRQSLLGFSASDRVETPYALQGFRLASAHEYEFARVLWRFADSRRPEDFSEKAR